ncbi:HAD hydrolase-like protein [Streptomyces sp. NPDC096538]|uniref:HAD hydrolase-like protein n=1 Tax=Streptomyces sp. NPDC096538 TaxID=3155427 RepID=UPI003327ECE6
MTKHQAPQIVDLMSSLPPHSEVTTALRKLADGPFRQVALTNSVMHVAEQQLRNAGIRELFDRVMSADSVRKLKPADVPYHAVATAFRALPSEVRLIAAHSWVITGALLTGCKAAFESHPGMVLSPIGRPSARHRRGQP